MRAGFDLIVLVGGISHARQDGWQGMLQIIQDLKDVNYDGYISLEEFGPGDDETKIAEQGAYLKKLING